MILFTIFILLITQFVSNHENLTVPKVDVSSSNELGNQPSIVGTFIFMPKKIIIPIEVLIHQLKEGYNQREIARIHDVDIGVISRYFRQHNISLAFTLDDRSKNIIREQFQLSKNVKDLSLEYGVSTSVIYRLVRGLKKSKSITHGSERKILPGDKFNYFIVIKEVEKIFIHDRLRRQFLCQCACGEFRTLTGGALNKRKTCGCLTGFVHPLNKLRNKEQLINDQRKASRKHYYLHLEQEKRRSTQWKLNNPDKVKDYSHRKSIRKRNAKCKGTHTYAEWQSLKLAYDFTCPLCNRKEPKIKLTKDHIIPISKDGSDDISNIQPLCAACNASKGNKIDSRYNTKIIRNADSFRK